MSDYKHGISKYLSCTIKNIVVHGLEIRSGV